MKIIMLAAGVGKRFNQNVPYLNEIPKCLVEIVDKKTILDINLENIFACSRTSEIFVITGFKSELIDRHIKATYCNNDRIKTALTAVGDVPYVAGNKMPFRTSHC